MIQKMNIGRIFRVISILTIFSLWSAYEAWAVEQLDPVNDVVVYVDKIPNNGGTVSVNSVGAESDGKRTVTLNVVPDTDNGYSISASLISVEPIIILSSSSSPAPRKAPGMIVNLTVTGSGTTYSFDLPSQYTAVFVTVRFQNGNATGITSLDEITDENGNYQLLKDVDASGFTSIENFSGTLDGNYHKIKNLSEPLFKTIDGGTVKNITFEGVSISSGNDDGDAGAVCCKAEGASRIYNCGILPTGVLKEDPDDENKITGFSGSSVGGTGNVGGLVGKLMGTSRVINCYSYATITSGNIVAGIVGNNTGTSNQKGVTTMVMNCIFYGDITGGSTVSPVYGGNNIDNRKASGTAEDPHGLATYNYYAYSQLKTKTIADANYNCTLGAEDRFLFRDALYRQLLNSNKKLAAIYATGNAANADQMAKWVLETADRQISNPMPYPVLRQREINKKYPSIINYDAEHATQLVLNDDGKPSETDRKKGGKLGTLNVIINGVGDNSPAANGGSASITKSSLQLIRTDKDEDRFNFNYDKVQLPYYNDVGTGNYTKNRVVTGWKITEITPTSGEGNAVKGSFTEGDIWGGYNFADRMTYAKDLYSESGRVFSQGAYFDVPYGVTSITIEPYWGTAAYVSDEYYDVVYQQVGTDMKNNYSSQSVNVSSAGLGKQYNYSNNKVSAEINGDMQDVYNTIANARTSLNIPTSGKTVYDYAVVLVGNVHQAGALYGNSNTPYSIMSVDLDKDNEPDYSFIFSHYNRQNVSSIRFDFLNMIGTAEAQKPNGADQLLNVSIFNPRGWFEITNTCTTHITQFEADNDNIKTAAPVIFLGGVIDQYTSTKTSEISKSDYNHRTSYIHLGSNVCFKEFGNGTHSDGFQFTDHVPVSVTGGDFEGFYLSGVYRPDAKVKADDAEGYISGGRFKEMAGAAQQMIEGDVHWQIYDADITNFYGGGINADKPITGNITTDIINSHVGTFCGGPKFGDMQKEGTTLKIKYNGGSRDKVIAEDGIVTTNATGCTFGTFFGAGYGGASSLKLKFFDKSTGINFSNFLSYYQRGLYFDGNDATYKSDYGNKGPGVATDFDYEFFVWSSGAVGARFYVNYTIFSLAKTRDVTSKLEKCIITDNFYGGGSCGKVEGTATSELKDCTVKGSVYAAGYSASKEDIPVPVRTTGYERIPSINKYAGIFDMGKKNGTTDYIWNKGTLTKNKTALDESSRNILTDVDLTALGQVDYSKLTILGTTTVKGSVYGGGQSSDTMYDAEVNVLGGTMEKDVYGGGEGNTTVVGGDVKVYIGKLKKNTTNEYEGNAEVKGSVYGGSALGAVNATKTTENNVTTYSWTNDKNTFVNVYKGAVNGNVYGGGLGDLASLGTGHSDIAAKVYGDVTVTVGAATETAATTVPIIEGSVYGGSNVNGVLEKGARVDIISGTIGKETTTSNTTTLSGGNVHGGGYGQPTLVKGDVTVNVGVETSDNPAKHYGFATIKGDVYGGSAKGNVNAEWVTDNSTTPATETLQHAGSTETNVNLYGSQSVRDIYGGGLGELGKNQNSEADDTPANVYGDVAVKVYGGTARYVFGCNNIFGTPKGTVDVTVYGTNATVVNSESGDRTYALQGVYGGGNQAHYDPTTTNATYPRVTINGCNSSIKDVFGGGNAAAVPNTNVIINGGDISRVFAGGNGESGTPANVGWKTVATSPADADKYAGTYDGAGSASLQIKGGTIIDVFGGSNANGKIRAGSAVNIAKDGSCGMHITNVFGGGNEAAGAAGTLTIGCTGTDSEGITNVFGGANKADVTGDIELNITGGRIANVYGGNNETGNIDGTITVNVEWNGSCENNYLGNVYGGGKDAAYGDADHNKGNYPVVNIKNGTVSGSVFGGGFGSTAVVYGNPQVTIGHATEGYDADVTGDVYGGGDAAAVEGTPVVHVINKDNTSIGNVYGGGNAADVSATSVTIDGGTIGMVFGGGHGDKNSDPQKAANVSGNVAVAINGGTITKVFGGSNSKGNIGGTITLGIEKSATASTMKIGEVYGGGNEADGNAGTINIGCTGTWTTEGTKNHTNHNNTDNRIGYELEGIGTVYGGANAANIGTSTAQSNISLTIGGGIIENVYGGNNTSGAISGTIDVNINKDDNATCAANWYVGNVFGGGNLAAYSGSPTVTVTNGQVSGRVFGGGNQADVGGSTVNINGGGVGQGVYGGCNTSGTIGGAVTVTVKGGTLGSSSAIEAITDKKPETLPNILFGGGKGSGTSVTGLVTLNVGESSSDNALIYGNVYGGSEEGEVSVANVNLNGNTIQGNVFGGGYRTADGKISATNVTVTLDGTKFDRTDDGTAQIFGANNVQGSPTGHVLVHVKNTAPVSGQTYDLAAVYGGGNNADYNPTDETQTAEVIIEGCTTTSIKNVYGGGNAAAVPGSEIWILGSKVIDNLFGGGNGEAGADYAAHVGFHRTSATTKSNYTSGEGTTYVKLVGGTIHTVYGGSNSNGDIRGGANILMPTVDEFTASHAGMSAPDCCSTLTTTNIYGGGKNADMSGGTTVVLGCVEGLDNVYGGAMSANIKGGVNLVVTSGTFKKVFGGNDTEGTIQGPINLYIEETGCDPLIIGELYLGGNLAPYSVYGYKQGTSGLEPRQNSSDGVAAEGTTAPPTSTGQYPDPVLHVTSFTSIGNVFGGGLGTSAVLYGNPTIEINEVVGKHAGEVDGYPKDANNQDITVLDEATIPPHAKDAIGAIGNVYGGGNLATVYGSTKVNIGTETTVGFKTEPVHLRPSTAPTTPLPKNATTGLYDIPVDGANITGNVYGGGNQADVTGNTQVNICAKYDATNDVYDLVEEGSAKVTISGDVFGAGKGVETDVTKALVSGNSTIVMKGGSVKKSVYGGGELSQLAGNTNITVSAGTIGTAKEDLPSGVTMGAVYGNIYGGGFGTADATITNYKLFGLIKGDTHVTVSGGDILHNVYGGGAYGSVGDFTFDDGTTANTGMPTGRKANTTGGNTYVTITGGNIGTTGQENGMVFGSSRGDVDVLGSDGIDPNDRLAWVYDTHVTIGTLNASTGPHIYGSLYGSGENGHTWNDTEVIVHSGTIGVTTASEATNITEGGETYSGAAYPNRGNIYGGGCGTDKYDSDNDNVKDSYNSLAGIVRGDATITITGGTIAHNVYGAGAMGSVGTADTGTQTTISISGGTIGVDGTVGDGNVFGAARGDKDTEQTDVALVKSTSVTISGTTTGTNIWGSVYGGGQMGNVQGTTTVDIQGGAIKKNVFGGGMGDASTYKCAKAMVGIEDEGTGADPSTDANKDKGTHVTISDGTVGTLNGSTLVDGTGNVYGGGEIARVEWNTQVTIGTAGETEGTNKPNILGNVFAAGKGLNTHGYSALVRGDSKVTVQGKANVGMNVYGGGEIATVGRYVVVDNLPTTNTSGGDCIVDIQDDANITGSVFGAGKGVLPYEGYTASETPWSKTATGRTEYTSANAAAYLNYITTLAIASDTHVTVKGNATVGGSVYGGGQKGFVQTDTDVKIQGSCHIGTSSTTTEGNVFGGGLGAEEFAEAGRVKGNTNLTVSGGTVYGNVYGGGSLGDVGTINKADIKNYKWIDSNGDYNNTGVCSVTISGGNVGPDNNSNTEKGNVFGAGKGVGDSFWCEKAMVYDTKVSIENGTVNGNVYGGGEVGRVENDTEVTVGRKTGEAAGAGTGTPVIKGSVFGAGKGLETHGYSALVRGNTTVTVEGGEDAIVENSVYGGGEIASVGRYGLDANEMPEVLVFGGTCIVNIQGSATIGSTTGNVFGAGKGVVPHFNNMGSDKTLMSRRMTLYTNGSDFPANAPTPKGSTWEYIRTYSSEELSNSAIAKYVWEYFQDEDKYKTYLETLALATHPEVTISGNATVNGSVFGGGELGITKGSVVVNIQGGTITEDVYGGGSLADTNTTKDVAKRDNGKPLPPDSNGKYDTEEVHPTTTVKLLGGIINGEAYGGGLGEEGKPAYVYGDVLVDLNGTTTMDTSTGKPTVNGTATTTAKGCVVNEVFGCNNVNGSPKANVMVHVYATQNKNATAIASKEAGNYDVKAVYGGGNQAAYVPVYDTSTKATAFKTQVIIEGCSTTSIETVYGGGNAAAVPETNVEIRSAYEIYNVFGGGNGYSATNNHTDPSAANYNPGADVGVYKEGSTEITYGTGNANAILIGGHIHEAYGGSNQYGKIIGKVNINTDPIEGGCPLDVEKIVGAGKNADVDGDLIIILGCKPITKTPLVFAGADNADVNGNVELTITSGTFGQVFGGNNLGGCIKGHIKLNIEETGCNPIVIDELYLGGNQAAYSRYGYYNAGTTGNPDIQPRTAAMHAIEEGSEGYVEPLTNPSNADGKHPFPYAQPELNVISCTSIGTVFGGGWGEGAVMYADPTVNINMIKGTANGSLTTLGSIGDVYGGGNAAKVIGNTTVNIGTATKVQLHESLKSDGVTYNMSDEKDVLGANITGNVYGGGKLADVGDTELGTDNDGNTIDVINVASNTFVNIGASKAEILDSNNQPTGKYNYTAVNLTGITIGGNVFGGGEGEAAESGTGAFRCGKAMVTGGTNIAIGNGTINGTVYGGGEVGRVEGNTIVTIGIGAGGTTPASAPEIFGDVFGAGKGEKTHGYSALVRGNPVVTIEGDAKVRGSVYGGGEIASVGKYNVKKGPNNPVGAPDDVLPGMPYSLANSGSGYCTVIVQGNAEIGPENEMKMKTTSGKPDNSGHVFGAGKGVLPYEGYGETDDPWKTDPWRVGIDDQKDIFNTATYSTNYEKEYFKFIETLALATETHVTIDGNAFVKGSVYGGSMNGHVQHDTHVTIAGGQIGQGEGVDGRYTDWTKNTLAECPHWDYDANSGAPYDPLAETDGTYKYDKYGFVPESQREETSKGGLPEGKDGHTYYGNVFGGGSGVIPYAPGKWHRGAGSVGGDTYVTITGGHILTSVYGGNEHTDVGTYTKDQNGQPTTTPVSRGKCTVNMTGGTVGVPRTDAEKLLHPVVGNLYGAGKGDQRIFFNTWTNVISAEVNISGDAHIFGSVFGGGEDGHIIGNVKTNIGDVTIKTGKNASGDEITENVTENGLIIGTTGTSYYDGNVFGGGRGFSGDAQTAGTVGGNVEVNIGKGAVYGSVYGGGRLASVGTMFEFPTLSTGAPNPAYGNFKKDDANGTYGHITVNISGGTIGNENATGDRAKYSGNVFGGSMGRLELLNGTRNPIWAKMAQVKSTAVNIYGDNTVIRRNVYGGGELGTVRDNASVTIGGYLTVSGNDSTITASGSPTIRRDVYGGGYGSDDKNYTIFSVYELNSATADPSVPGNYDPTPHTYAYSPMQFAGCVGQNTYVNVAGGYIRKSVYGGGEMASVGVINYRAKQLTGTATSNQVVIEDENKVKYYYTDMVKHAYATKEFALSWPYKFNYVKGYEGATHVNITGGRIGLKSNDSDASYTDNGDVYGAGKGLAGDYKDYLFCANVGSTDVIIDYGSTPEISSVYFNYDATSETLGTDADCIAGAVYGGGEDGHVMGDTKLTLENGLIAHSVYGAGSGKGLFDATVNRIDNPTSTITRKIYSITAGKVFGNSTVVMNGGYVMRNIYGGGNMGSVGKGNYAGGPDDYSTAGYGETLPEGKNLWDKSNEFSQAFLNSGRCEVKITGGTVGYIHSADPSKSMYPKNSSASLPYGNVFGGCRGEAAPNITESPRYLYSPETFVGYANETSVTIEGDAKIRGSVYGGGMDGHVRRDASVTIKGGEIGVPYSDTNKGTLGTNPDNIQWLARGNVYGSGSGIGKYKYDFNYDGNYTTATYHGNSIKEEDYSTSAGSVTRFTKVDIQGGTIYRNIYGGGSLSSIGAPKIGQDYYEYRKGDTAEGHGVGKQTLNEVIISGGQIGDANSYDANGNHVYGGHVFGGSRGDASLEATTPATFSTSMFTSISINKTGTTDPVIAGNVFGGGEVGIVKGSVDVTMNGGTVNHDVYGGGALANTNTANVTSGYGTDSEVIGSTSTYKTTVNLLGGLIKGDAYGGGLGRLANAAVTAVAAMVYGDVKVELNNNNSGGTADGDKTGCAVSRVFGCNNLNGSPKGKVQVYVYATQMSGENKKLKDKPTLNSNTYDVQAVYGGGNLAAYLPANPETTTERSEVYIEGCQLTSIKQVYGGGNAASAPATLVRVNSAYEIDEVFGGGNGYDPYTLNGETYVNPGANVGYYNYTHFVKNTTTGKYEPVDNTTPDCSTKENRVANYSYGSGIARLEVTGGMIHTTYGGSNAKGNIRVKASSSYSASGDCDMQVDQSYGGGKDAPIDGEVEMVADCAHGIKEMFGGSKNADVDNDINLIITNGSTLERVFGGNNTSGAINGSITVTIEEGGCEPIQIDELYLGGYLAPYSVYGYKKTGDIYDTEDVPYIENNETKYHTQRIPLESGDNPKKDPRIYIISATKIGNIFGGGYQAKLVGNPHVNVNMEQGKVLVTKTEVSADDASQNKFEDGGKYYVYKDAAGNDYNQTKVTDIEGKVYATLEVGTIDNIYGGGNMADIIGDTYVEIGTGTWHNDNDVLETEDADGKKWTYDETTNKWTCAVGGAIEDVAPAPRRNAAHITGNVFGGGKGVADSFECKKAMVGKDGDGIEHPNGGTNVIIGNGTVEGTVYGGGEVGRVEKNTVVTIGLDYGTSTPVIEGNVFGAGQGRNTHGYSALVRGNSTVTVQGSAHVKGSVYGGGQIATVGRYKVNDAGLPTEPNGGGLCTVVIKDNAVIGPDANMRMNNTTTNKPDDAGHVFGAGKGVLPYEGYTDSQEPQHMDGDRQEDGSWTDHPRSYKAYNDASATQEDIDKYFEFIQTLALASETSVTIGGNAFVKGTVYGGSENGFVQKNTAVVIQENCQIGSGKNTTEPYGAKWNAEKLNPSDFAECDTWPYGQATGDAQYAPYDPYALASGYYSTTESDATSAKGGYPVGDDGHTFYGNVFGGGSGYYPYRPGKWFKYAGQVRGNTSLTISGGHILSNVYGGNEMTDVLGNSTITMTGGTIGVPRTAESIALLPTVGHLYGAGKGDKRIFFNTSTNVDNTSISITGGTIYGNVYGGGEDGHVLGNANMTIDQAADKTTVIGSTGTSGFDGDVFGGGQGSVTALTAGVVGGDVNLNIVGGSVLGSAYGGGRLASVGTFFKMADDPYYGKMQKDANGVTHGHITVNLIGGTINQNVYGGCMGSTTNNRLAVSKNVTVNLNGVPYSSDNAVQTLYTSWGLVQASESTEAPYIVADDKKGCVVKGNVFGCNNLESSPLGDVLVHVYGTQKDGASQIANTPAGEGTVAVEDAKTPATQYANGEFNLSSFDVKAVYGGGNLAAYRPQGPNVTATDYDYANTTHVAKVIIDGCGRTSIGHVYGGGNAASTPATEVTVNGTYEIGELFGGGNGKDDVTIDGVTKPNPGANVGYYNYSIYEKDGDTWKVKDDPNYDTKEKRLNSPIQYGTGKAAVNIFGGTIHRVFGGSNTKGNVRQSAITLLEEAGGCDFCVDEAYGGGKSAPMDAEAKLLMACIPGLKEVYGGAQAADVYDDVSVTVTNGNFDRVFGGNNLSGTIRGKITVNVEETGCRPVIIGELYGGGNKAGYSVYGYNDDGSMIESGETPLYQDPQVNVRSFTSIGNIYGGGYGKDAVMVGNPTVNINESVGTPLTYPTTGDYDTKGFKGKVITVGSDGDKHEVTLPSHTKDKIGAINNVFGGGNAAKVIGNTNVNIGTETTQTYVSIDDNPATTDVNEKVKTVVGADIRGNVYGGGNNAEVTGDTNVTIGQEKKTE